MESPGVNIPVRVDAPANRADADFCTMHSGIKARTRLITFSLRFIGVISFFFASYWLYDAYLRPPAIYVQDVSLRLVLPGEQVYYSIPVFNRGSRPLRITDVATSCGCVVADEYPGIIAPLSSGIIPRVIHAPMSSDPFNATVVIHSNDPSDPEQAVHIAGSVVTELTSNQGWLFLDPMEAGTWAKDAAVITWSEDGKRPVSAVVTSPHLTVKLHDDPKSDTTSLDLNVAAQTPRGEYHEYVVVRTDSRSRPYVILPVSVNVYQGMRLFPEQAYFGVVKGCEKVTRRIRLSPITSNWHNVSISNTTELPEYVSVSLTRRADLDNQTELVVELDPNRVPPQLKTYVALVDDQFTDAINVPILAIRDVPENDADAIVVQKKADLSSHGGS